MDYRDLDFGIDHLTSRVTSINSTLSKQIPRPLPPNIHPEQPNVFDLRFHFGQINCPPLNKKGDESRISCYFDAGNSLDHCFR